MLVIQTQSMHLYSVNIDGKEHLIKAESSIDALRTMYPWASFDDIEYKDKDLVVYRLECKKIIVKTIN